MKARLVEHKIYEHPCNNHNLELVSKSYSNGSQFWVHCLYCDRPLGLMTTMKELKKLREAKNSAN